MQWVSQMTKQTAKIQTRTVSDMCDWIMAGTSREMAYGRYIACMIELVRRRDEIGIDVNASCDSISRTYDVWARAEHARRFGGAR